MRRNPAGLLSAATQIGHALCASAYWHEDRCNWVGRTSREAPEPGMSLTPTVAALGPDLYSGTAGVALFLAALHALAGIDDAEPTARGAIRNAMSRSGDVPSAAASSFHSGMVGIAYASARVGQLLDDTTLIADGVELAHRAVSTTNRERLLDVISGNAGAIAPLLWLARLPNGAGLDSAAMQLAVEIADAAIKDGNTWSWDNEHACGKGVGSKPLCGFGHGASGMGLALIESGVHSGRAEWIDGGLAAFRYEDQLYDDEHGNWPDLRELGVHVGEPRAPKRTSFMVAWCHGAAGIGLARLRALQLLPERRAELLLGVRRAIQVTAAALKALPEHADASPCHGRAGMAETLLYASELLGDQEYADQVVKSWRRIVKRRTADTPWPCGVASGRNNPSLMLGYAGIGYALLRAHRPSRTQLSLLVQPYS